MVDKEELQVGDAMTDDKYYERPARPWDLFNKNIEKVSAEIQKGRMEICRECPKFLKITTQCIECGCIMEAKTKLPHAYCPLGKWDVVKFDENSVSYKE